MGLPGSCIYVDPDYIPAPKMMARLFLVRHAAHSQLGKTLTGRDDGLPLSPEGEAQAARLANALRSRDVAAIHSSPRLRTWRTAAAIAGSLHIDVERVDALDEVDFGDWTGRSFAELDTDPRWQAWNSARSRHSAPGGESMSEAVSRIVGHIDAMLARAQAWPLLLVTHCDMIRGAICHYLGLGIDNILRFDIDPASVSTLDVGPWGGKVTSLNEVFA